MQGQLNFSGINGGNFIVEYSTNLTTTNWFYLQSVSNLQNGSFQFVDTNGIQPARYYRVIMR